MTYCKLPGGRAEAESGQLSRQDTIVIVVQADRVVVLWQRPPISIAERENWGWAFGGCTRSRAIASADWAEILQKSTLDH